MNSTAAEENSTNTDTISCRIIGEFDVDASAFAEGEPEFVTVDTPAQRWVAGPAGVSAPARFVLPSDEALAAAKKFWLKVICRFTEPVPGNKSRCRVRDSGEPNRGAIEIDCGRYVPAASLRRDISWGHELDVSDKQCLTIFRHEGPMCWTGDEDRRVRELAMPIPWTEIVNIQFEVRRPVPHQQPAASLP
jgi:hypothetical protein